MKVDFKADHIIILFLLTLILFSMAVTNPFHTDESIFIHTSLFFENTLKLDLSDSVWDISFYTLCAPMLPRYFIGASRLIAGYDASQVNLPYDIQIDRAENIEQGRVPEDGLLFASRVPMVIFAIFALMFYYLLLKQSYHWLAGVLFLGLILANPLIPSLLLRAMSEAPLMAFFVITALFCLKAQKNWLAFSSNPQDQPALKRSYFSFILCGVGVGLAASSKINAFSIGFSVAIMMAYVIFFAKSELEKRDKIKYFIRLGLFVVFAAILTFIVLNPFLYPDPIVRMGLFLKYRVQEIDLQVGLVPADEVVQGNMFQRWAAIFKSLLTDLATIQFTGGFWLNLVLMFAGIGSLASRLINQLKQRGGLSLVSIVLILAFPMIFASFFSPLWWSRYFYFPTFFLLLAIAIGIWFLLDQGTRWGRKLIQPKISS